MVVLSLPISGCFYRRTTHQKHTVPVQRAFIVVEIDMVQWTGLEAFRSCSVEKTSLAWIGELTQP